MKDNRKRVISIVFAVVAALIWWVGTGADQQGSEAVGSDVLVSDGHSLVAATLDTQFSNLDIIEVSDLPPEGRQTLQLINDNGPFPFDRDGLTFQNREGILPDQGQGYYQEYTVITPGSSDRGARRVVTGERGDRYYTADHYDSFREIVEDASS